jgi:hypothetical protein
VWAEGGETAWVGRNAHGLPSSPAACLLPQPGGFEGFVPLLIEADTVGPAVADCPDQGAGEQKRTFTRQIQRLREQVRGEG